MRIGVPGEFHEDRWPRTAEDSERRVLPRTREAGGDVQTLWSEVMSECAPAHTGSGRSPSDTSYRVAKRSFDRSSARRPCPQMPQCHPRVAKRTSIGTLARGPSTEALLGQGRVPKGRESVPLQGLRSGSRPGLARHTRLQVVLRQGRVTKGTSIGTLARRPCPQVPQSHPRVAKGSSIGSSARGPCPQPSQSHPGVAEGVFRPPKGSFCPSGESFCPSGWSFCHHIHAEGGIFGNGI